MRVNERVELISKIGRELQSRYGYDDIDAYLGGFDIAPPVGVTANSKWVYAKAALRQVPDNLILRIADELEITTGATITSLVPPKNWAGTQLFRLFISHVAAERLKATRLKECLLRYGISGFVAHEDIHPTLAWQDEIERALGVMDAFVAILTPGFSESNWTQQEIGFALGRGVKVVSLRMGEDPTGFISRHQALSRRDRKAEEVAAEIDLLLDDDSRTSTRLKEARKSVGLFHDDDIPF